MTFKPGQSGNPGGRPKKKEQPYVTALRMEIAAAGEDLKALRAVARAHLEKAAGGDVPAIRELADRLDGKVPQAIIGDENEAPVQVSLIERRIVDPRDSNAQSIPAATGTSEV